MDLSHGSQGLYGLLDGLELFLLLSVVRFKLHFGFTR